MPKRDQGKAEPQKELDGPSNGPTPGVESSVDVPSQQFLPAMISDGPDGMRRKGRLTLEDLVERLEDLQIRPTVPPEKLLEALRGAQLDSRAPRRKFPDEVKQSQKVLIRKPQSRHGAKIPLSYFPGPAVRSRCANMFGYMSLPGTRASTKLPFDVATRAQLEALGAAMAAPGADAGADSTLPAGFTYAGQFIDHDITLDVSSSLDVSTDANTIHNMRTPSLDLDSLYGRGPALDPFLYVQPPVGNPTAIKLRVGTNTPVGPGGPGGPAGPAGMVAHNDRDVPRMGGSDHTAVIGDPRNDENLIVVEFHHAMLQFHNAVVDFLVAAAFPGDVFVEAKKVVTHHYQWAVLHDFAESVCGSAAVGNALGTVAAGIGSSFRMPVEFAVAAYRFGHSMVRDRYFVNFNFPAATLGQVFAFNRVPLLPVFSNWVVDFNAYFETGIAEPGMQFNFARKIDTALANGLASLPGFTGIMAELATRNLLRGLALGLPSGQGMATELGTAPLTAVELTNGLPPAELAALSGNGGALLKRTPLWYYILREAVVQEGGERLGAVGARIVADTFVRILKRDADSFLNVGGGFTPFLPSAIPNQFTFADLVNFSGVTLP